MGGCPVVTIDRNVDLVWNKVVNDVNNASNTYKLVASQPIGTPAEDVKDTAGTPLAIQSSWFSFKPQGAYMTKWKMGFNMKKLPETMYNGISKTSSPCVACALFTVVAILA